MAAFCSSLVLVLAQLWGLSIWRLAHTAKIPTTARRLVPHTSTATMMRRPRVAATFSSRRERGRAGAGSGESAPPGAAPADAPVISVLSLVSSWLVRAHLTAAFASHMPV